MKKQTMHIGIDDTDSTRKGCTTHIIALLIDHLEKINIKFIDYPNLIRLNPNVPWKTRGNGALCLRIEYELEIEEEIKQITKKLVEKHSDLEFENTNPGIVFLKKKEIPQEINFFSKNAIEGIVSLKIANKLIRKYELDSIGFNNSRGIIGALGAIGEELNCDHTFELIAYREKHNFGKKRRVDKNSIFMMDNLTKPFTFNNIDLEKSRVIITPRGPDPILFGIRGESAQVVKKAFSVVKSFEKIDKWVIFRTNQGTDVHLKRVENIGLLKPYSSIIVKGTVSNKPYIIPLRHVIFSIKDKSGEVDCAAYEPTGLLRKVSRKLMLDDEIEVFGAVKQFEVGKSLTINLEKIRILTLSPKIKLSNPICEICGKRLKSEGKNKGFGCDKCHKKYGDKQKERVIVNRNIKKGIYITSARSQRHLTKPFRRYGLEKSCHDKKEVMIEKWHNS